MIPVAIVLLFVPTKGKSILDASIASRQKLGDFSVHIETDTVVPGKHEQLFLDYKSVGATSLLRAREPLHDGLASSDRSIRLSPNSVTAYDAVANEWIKRPYEGKEANTERLTAILGQIPDALRMGVDSKFYSSFLAQFKLGPEWNVTQGAGITTLFRKVGKSDTTIRFDGKSMLLKDLTVKIPKSNLKWSFQFSTASKTDLSIPTDAIQVSSFTVQSVPPRFKSALAKQVVDKMVYAYRTLNAGVIEVEDSENPDRNAKLTIGGRWLREDRKSFSWAYNGKTLTVYDRRTNKVYQGEAARPIIAEYVVKVGCEVDPIIRRLLQKRAPFSDLLSPKALVSHKGIIGSGNTSSDIIQVSEVNPQASIFVRQDNHLVDSIELEAVDRNGRVISRSNEMFHYTGIGTMPRAVDFKIDTGSAKVQPLPEIKTQQN